MQQAKLSHQVNQDNPRGKRALQTGQAITEQKAHHLPVLCYLLVFFGSRLSLRSHLGFMLLQVLHNICLGLLLQTSWHWFAEGGISPCSGIAAGEKPQDNASQGAAVKKDTAARERHGFNTPASNLLYWSTAVGKHGGQLVVSEVMAS